MPCVCLRDQQRRKMNRVRSQGEQQPAEKQCRDCERLLPIDDFSRNYTYEDGFARNCKECKVKVFNANNAKRKLRFGGQRPGAPPPDVRICMQCKQIKPYSEFSANRTQRASGINSYCKNCHAMSMSVSS